MSLDQLDQVLAGAGAKGAFNIDTPVGTSVTGTITAVDVRQATDYVTGKPKTWDDGNPQMQIVITLATDLRDPAIDDDDGTRAIYIKTWGPWKEALSEAIREAGGRKASDVLVPGARFTDTFTGTKPSTQGSPTKIHAYRITPAQTVALDQTVDVTGLPEAPAPIPATPAPATAPATAAPQPAPAADPVATARQLIGLGVPDPAIATATGLPESVIAAIRGA